MGNKGEAKWQQLEMDRDPVPTCKLFVRNVVVLFLSLYSVFKSREPQVFDSPTIPWISEMIVKLNCVVNERGSLEWGNGEGGKLMILLLKKYSRVKKIKSRGKDFPFRKVWGNNSTGVWKREKYLVIGEYLATSNFINFQL